MISSQLGVRQRICVQWCCKSRCSMMHGRRNCIPLFQRIPLVQLDTHTSIFTNVQLVWTRSRNHMQLDACCHDRTQSTSVLVKSTHRVYSVGSIG